ncbi:MAG TPA: hypothetical protein VJZ72_09645 [Candidatus Limnocylindrales bacterium]|nr:hypothetical protein [Candidatus Limnocylindrales bacterium]
MTPSRGGPVATRLVALVIALALLVAGLAVVAAGVAGGSVEPAPTIQSLP